jgi:hypothetical protein
MILCVDVTKVVILVGKGADKVSLFTTEDSPTFEKEPLSLDFTTTAGRGFKYVTEVLRIDDEYVEVINA